MSLPLQSQPVRCRPPSRRSLTVGVGALFSAGLASGLLAAWTQGLEIPPSVATTAGTILAMTILSGWAHRLHPFALALTLSGVTLLLTVTLLLGGSRVVSGEMLFAYLGLLGFCLLGPAAAATQASAAVTANAGLLLATGAGASAARALLVVVGVALCGLVVARVRVLVESHESAPGAELLGANGVSSVLFLFRSRIGSVSRVRVRT